MNILVTQTFLGYLFEKYKNHINAFCGFIIVFAWNYRIYGLNDLKNDIVPMLIGSAGLLAGTTMAILVQQKLVMVVTQ